jgi:SAM-dependent methyltransferase
MYMSAFGRAMLDQVAHPERHVTFGFAAAGLPRVQCRCSDFTRMSAIEDRLIRQCLSGVEKPNVLDIGCGIGRHSALVRTVAPHARITLVDTDPNLLAHACNAVPGSDTCARFEDVPEASKFDLVFLMGNGLGVFGTEQATRDGLKRLAGMMSKNGHALIESGNFTGEGFSAIHHTRTYGNLTDEFTWGYATREWVESALGGAGLRAVSYVSSPQPGPFFIAHARLVDDWWDWEPNFDPCESPRVVPSPQGYFYGSL